MLLHMKKLDTNPSIILLSTAKASTKYTYSLLLSIDLSRLL